MSTGALQQLMTTAEVAEREDVNVSRINALARAGRFTGCEKKSSGYVFSPDYELLPPPKRSSRLPFKLRYGKGPKAP